VGARDPHAVRAAHSRARSQTSSGPGPGRYSIRGAAPPRTPLRAHSWGPAIPTPFARLTRALVRPGHTLRNDLIRPSTRCARSVRLRSRSPELVEGLRTFDPARLSEAR
jgi:hypothetical protein